MMMVTIVNQNNQTIITEEFLTNNDMRNRKKIQKSCITNRKHKKNTLPKLNDSQTDDKRRENIKAVSSTNMNIKDHIEN